MISGTNRSQDGEYWSDDGASTRRLLPVYIKSLLHW